MTLATRIVSRTMRQFGKTRIWSNKYKNCRTVKCYQSDVDAGMLKNIYSALDNNGVGYQITVKKIDRPFGRSSLIIRLPL